MNAKLFLLEDDKTNCHYYNDKEKKKMEKQIFYANNEGYMDDRSEGSDSSSEECVESSATRGEPRGAVRQTGKFLSMWERGAPIKLCSLPGDDAFNITFKNYKNIRYEELSRFLNEFGQYLSIRELGENYVRVRFKTEEEIRKCYKALKKNANYEVSVLLDIGEYKEFKRREKKYGLLKRLRHNTLPANDEIELKNDEVLQENNPIFEKALRVEAAIGFNVPKIQTLKMSCKKKSVNKENTPTGHRVGTWNGNTVIEPEIPFVNKHLDPPLSYLKWKASKTDDILARSGNVSRNNSNFSTDGTSPRLSARSGNVSSNNSNFSTDGTSPRLPARSGNVSRNNSNFSTDGTSPRLSVNSVERREADSTTNDTEEIHYGQDFPYHTFVPRRDSIDLSSCRSQASSDSLIIDRPKNSNGYLLQEESVSSKAESDLDSSSQMLSANSEFSPSEDSVANRCPSQNKSKPSKYFVSKPTKVRRSSRGNDVEEKKISKESKTKVLSTTQRSLPIKNVCQDSDSSVQSNLQEMPFVHRNLSNSSTPNSQKNCAVAKAKSTISPHTSTKFIKNNSCRVKKNVYEFSENSSFSDDILQFSLGSGTCSSEDSTSRSTGSESLLEYLNKSRNRKITVLSKDYSGSIFDNGHPKKVHSSHETLISSSDNDIIYETNVAKVFDEHMPPLVSIFNLYTMWLRKSVFEMI